jgi:hypothetical protein
MATGGRIVWLSDPIDVGNAVVERLRDRVGEGAS